MNIIIDHYRIFIILRKWIGCLLLGMFGVIFFILLTALIDSEQMYEAAIRIVPIGFLVLFSFVFLRLIAVERILLLTPLPVFIGYTALIFGLGPLVMYYGPADITDTQYLPTGTAARFGAQVLSLTGLFLTTLSVWILVSWQIRRTRPYAFMRALLEQNHPTRSVRKFFGFDRLSDRHLLNAFLVFVGVAIFLRLTKFIFDRDLTDSLPGFLGHVDKIGWLAVFVAGVLAGRRGGWFWFLFIPALLFEVGAGFLILYRTHILMPILVGVLALRLGGRSVRILYIGVVLVFFIMIATRPIVDHARVASGWHLDAGVSWPERFEAYRSLDTEHFSLRNSLDGQAGWWGRLNYAGMQAAAMSLYDNGRPGDTFSLIPWTLVPRMLYPEKPIFDQGSRFREAVYGFRDRTAIASTVYGEAYWNGGWVATVVSAIIFGLILFITTWCCLWLFGLGRLSAWPLGFIGIISGFSLDNTFSSSVIGGFVIFLWLLMFYYLLLLILKKNLW